MATLQSRTSAFASDRREHALRHSAPLTWHSRQAPLVGGRGAPDALWRERAAAHRERLIGSNSTCSGTSRHGPRLDARPEPAPVPLRNHAEHLAAEDGVGDASIAELTDDGDDGGLEEDEENCSDHWSMLMRIDIARYAAFRNAQLSKRALDGDTVARLALDCGGFTAAVEDAVTFERSMLRRKRRCSEWPQEYLGVGTEDERAALRQGLEGRINKLETLRLNDSDMRTVLKVWPLDVLLRQLLSDSYGVQDGQARSATGQVLLEALPAGESLQHLDTDKGLPARFPLLIAWEEEFDCRYAKAQQCMRFARVSLAAPDPELRESHPLADREKLKVAEEAITRARRLLQDARRLYKAELSDVLLEQRKSKALMRNSGPSEELASWNSAMMADTFICWGPKAQEELILALHIAHLGATALLIVAYRRLRLLLVASGRSSGTSEEAAEIATIQEAHKELQEVRSLAGRKVHEALQLELDDIIHMGSGLRESKRAID